ncbi:MAG: putative glycolipid-binding domain-containing protein [Actinomycetota bacterium]|nr:putative glycolipid-binding domain-containing protein [Actinomycetota bacterium]
MKRPRLVLWRGLESWLAEVVSLELGVDRLDAAGTQIGADPLPYRLDYRLSTGPAFVTQRLSVEAVGDGWARRIHLAHRGDGTWTCEAEEQGEPPLGAAGGDVGALRGALDCDLARSPLTNLMPVRRHHLHERPGRVDFLMAWVSVPDLAVRPSEQRYVHVRRGDDLAVVRYEGRHRDFVGDLTFDPDGIVETYPHLASRVRAP